MKYSQLLTFSPIEDTIQLTESNDEKIAQTIQYMLEKNVKLEQEIICLIIEIPSVEK